MFLLNFIISVKSSIENDEVNIYTIKYESTFKEKQ